MKPYYEQDGVTIYCGDCREILPRLGGVDLLVTDPPYKSLDVEVGTGSTTRLVSRDQFGGKRLASAEKGPWFTTLDADEIVRIVRGVRVSTAGARYVFSDPKSALKIFPALSPANMLVWDKGRIGMGYSWRRSYELIAYCPEEAHVLRDNTLGDIIRVAPVTDKVHPTEKPVGVIAALLRNSSDRGALVLDPFSGSGSTLLAAKNLGRRAIGIELSQSHCQTAVCRLSQGVLNLGGVA